MATDERHPLRRIPVPRSGYEERSPLWVLVLSAAVFAACGSAERASTETSSGNGTDEGDPTAGTTSTTGATATSTSTGGVAATSGATLTTTGTATTGTATTGTATTGTATTGTATTGTATTGTATTGSEGTGVACDVAVDADPCAQHGEMCGPLDGYGCAKFCVGGSWRVNCTEPPTCDTSTIEQLGACDSTTALRCGPFAVETACGEVSATAVCGWLGWYYELPCDPPCEALDEGACNETIGCAWVVSCNNEFLEELEPGCRDLPPLTTTCASASCPEGTTCVETAVNPHDLASGDCSNAGSSTRFCVAP